MDFGALLSVAQRNKASKQSANYYQSKFTPPKKESKQSGRLSENIKKFLARKEEEEKQKALEEKRKRDNLLALRDHKAQSRINKHLKVCKSANKSAIADAINNEDTAITMAGPSQPDEDDYGYVSQEASAFYNQLMNKYNNLPPEKPLFSESSKKVVKDIASTKDRVKQALKQQEIEESLPHRRKRKSQSASERDEREKEVTEDEKSIEKEDKPKPKKRPPAPPPIDFMSLLKIAEKKQYEPIIIETKPKPKVEERERLMTKKQMKEYQKEKEWREKKDREKNAEITKPPAILNGSNETSKLAKALTGKIPKLNNGKSPVASVEKRLHKPLNQVPKKNGERPPEKSIGSVPNSSSKNVEKSSISEERRKLEAERKEIEAMRRMIEEEKRKWAMTKNKKVDGETRSSSSSTPPTNKSAKPNGKILNSSNSSSNNKDVKPRQFPPADVRPKQFPPADIRPRQFPPADMKGRPSKPLRNGKPGNKRRIYDDSDEDYDSELDDFIDDGPQDQSEDYSKYISEIFGYDKNKYRHYDEDDVNMESNYAQQLKEEFVSAKIGIMEDLEDIRKEALEKKRKAIAKKKIKK